MNIAKAKKPPVMDDLIYIDFSPRLRTSSYASTNCLVRKVIFSQTRQIATVLTQLMFPSKPNFPQKFKRNFPNFDLASCLIFR